MGLEGGLDLAGVPFRRALVREMFLELVEEMYLMDLSFGVGLDCGFSCRGGELLLHRRRRLLHLLQGRVCDCDGCWHQC
jgi:hypothetical protein